MVVLEKQMHLQKCMEELLSDADDPERKPARTRMPGRGLRMACEGE